MQAPTPSVSERGCWVLRWGPSKAHSASSSTTSSRGRHRGAWGSCWGTVTRRRRCYGLWKETRGLTGGKGALSCPKAPKSIRWVLIVQQWWNVTKYNYWSANLWYLYFTWVLSFHATLYVYFTTFQRKILYFVLDFTIIRQLELRFLHTTYMQSLQNMMLRYKLSHSTIYAIKAEMIWFLAKPFHDSSFTNVRILILSLIYL